ncbi:hypothetical protein BG04_5660 (plasmid) [Priestia megaterium NBRC 15308 = ATCC 14581]|uniref:Uncharacterized protein n=1 Tax=Priestia megaterium (strain ATCC 14581 / DSM 32 / CCUG 1817 / JCM 2506 / NBRC 15308 / NCIMB 9376 / NCTC 10342 / NRRL B-14308 / VKM B-512 / Ford 19) TaxID=1348623 RepID=A0A0B6ALZ3_PRIM2|nr:hypothetical protein BG04_5660 [Priestia megaterium NBRC 15308 = ATCC 14581]
MMGNLSRKVLGGEGVREDSFLPDLSRKIAYFSARYIINN